MSMPDEPEILPERFLVPHCSASQSGYPLPLLDGCRQMKVLSGYLFKHFLTKVADIKWRKCQKAVIVSRHIYPMSSLWAQVQGKDQLGSTCEHSNELLDSLKCWVLE
jgi:hypothetical protein